MARVILLVLRARSIGLLGVLSLASAGGRQPLAICILAAAVAPAAAAAAIVVRLCPPCSCRRGSASGLASCRPGCLQWRAHSSAPLGRLLVLVVGVALLGRRRRCRRSLRQPFGRLRSGMLLAFGHADRAQASAGRPGNHRPLATREWALGQAVRLPSCPQLERGTRGCGQSSRDCAPALRHTAALAARMQPGAWRANPALRASLSIAVDLLITRRALQAAVAPCKLRTASTWRPGARY